ncbi:MAG: (2Fe-2S) ferredoxin domain-containing protein [Pseudanabaenaceae cyanobacterium]
MAIAEGLVLVCQYHSCSKCGSEKVLAEFVHTAPVGVTVQGTGCLGLCASGPIVLVIPDQVYYWRVPPLMQSVRS